MSIIPPKKPASQEAGFAHRKKVMAVEALSGTWVLVGVAGLVIWLFGGVLNAVSYSSPPRPSGGYSTVVMSALFVAGGVLELVMIVGILTESLSN